MVQVSVGWNSREAKQTRTQHKSSDTNGRSALEEISSTGRTGSCIQWSLTLCPPTFSPDRQKSACAAWGTTRPFKTTPPSLLADRRPLTGVHICTLHGGLNIVSA
ncbi:hypothetical protein MHYP_G00279060 [Metynnis hypsauchen]